MPSRTPEQVREHYEMEKALATRLKRASKEERRSSLNVELHEELFRRIPHHPLLTKQKSRADRQEYVARQLRKFSYLIDPDKSFLEIGPGDCALSLAVAEKVRRVFAIDVNKILSDNVRVPENFELIISDGVSIPVPEGSIDIAFSNQVMEHLHPEDSLEQLENIYRSLAPEGVYFCDTPNRLNGPHDVSRNFDEVASGFHLKEYTTSELTALFRNAGFSRIQMCTKIKDHYYRLPTFPAILLEKVLELLPLGLRSKLANTRLVRLIINVSLVGKKA